MRLPMFLCAVFGAIFWNSCTTDFDLTTEWKDIPIVYGILDLQDEVHYIRIEKAFIDPDESALEIAQIPDSLYYESLDVKIRKGNQEFSLEEINAEEEGLIREDGVFASSPNILYKISNDILDLQADDELEFTINRGDNLPAVTATTKIVGASEFTEPGATEPLSFNQANGTDMAWKPGINAAVFDVRFIIHYDEFPTGNVDAITSHELEWVIDKSVIASGGIRDRIDDRIQGEDFYAFIGGGIEEKPDYTRVFKGMDMILTGAGTELNSFIEIINANTGITGAQDIPVFTNLSEGRGVFSSRHKLVVLGKQINASTRDSLRNGQFTKDLNFL